MLQQILRLERHVWRPLIAVLELQVKVGEELDQEGFELLVHELPPIRRSERRENVSQCL